MVNVITNVGEEYLYENNADGETVTVGLYEDATERRPHATRYRR